MYKTEERRHLVGMQLSGHKTMPRYLMWEIEMVLSHATTFMVSLVSVLMLCTYSIYFWRYPPMVAILFQGQW